ncbi:MAG: pilus assembly protein PilM [Oligoflexia bacterium]|nr:pilus assembly protein PilM [Oligoflexia bacterium]
MRIVGVDIGSYSVKAALVETRLNSSQLKDFVEIELSHDPAADQSIEQVAALRQIIAKYNPLDHKYVVGLSSEYATHRVITFPFLERKKILQSLPFELEDTIPFSQDDAVFDFRVISQEATHAKVLAVAVLNRNIENILKFCSDVGLDPDVISLDGIALSSIFPPWEGAGENISVQLHVHIGHKRSLINIMSGQSLVGTRCVYFGGHDLAVAVGNAYQLPYIEALKTVAEKSFVLTNKEGASEDQVHFSQIIEKSLSPLLQEINRTIVDVKSDQPEMAPTQAILSGGMSRILNLGPYLTQTFEIPFNVFHHLGRTLRSEIGDTDRVDRASSIAVGLAIEGTRKPRDPAINLRKGEYSKQGKNLKVFWESHRGLIQGAAVLFFVILFYTSLRISFMEENLSAVDTQLKAVAKAPSLNLSSKELKPEPLKRFIKGKQDEIKSKHEVVRLSQMTSALDILKHISQSIPQKGQITLDLKEFNVDGENVTVEGFVGSQSEVEQVKKALSSIPGSGTLTLTGSRTQAPAGKVGFLVTMGVSRVKPPEKKN